MKFITTCVLAVSAFLWVDHAQARPWTNKDGRQMEADFVGLDAENQVVTVKKGVKEYKIALNDLCDDDKKWVAENGMPKNPVSGGVNGANTANNTNAENAENAENGANAENGEDPARDPILLLLGKSRDDVVAAMRTMKMINDEKSVVRTPRQRMSDHASGTRETYDNGKLEFEYFNNKVTTITLLADHGYEGPFPFGLVNDKNKYAFKGLSSRGFKFIDYGDSPPGFGWAYALKSDPRKVVAIITANQQAKGFLVIRLMDNS